jgi:hypothetical protein
MLMPHAEVVYRKKERAGLLGRHVSQEANGRYCREVADMAAGPEM